MVCLNMRNEASYLQKNICLLWNRCFYKLFLWIMIWISGHINSLRAHSSLHTWLPFSNLRNFQFILHIWLEPKQVMQATQWKDFISHFGILCTSNYHRSVALGWWRKLEVSSILWSTRLVRKYCQIMPMCGKGDSTIPYLQHADTGTSAPYVCTTKGVGY